jgi:hypothetical protein
MKPFFQTHATRRNILILIGMMLIIEILFGVILPKGENARMIDTAFVTSGSAIYEIIGNYDAGMRQAYIWGAVTLDLIFPIVYFLLFAFLLFAVWKNAKLAIIPLLQMIFDYLENAGVVTMLSIWPDKLDWLASVTVVFSLIKWGLAGITVILIIIGTIRYLSKR